MPIDSCRSLVLSLSLLLAGCGTDIKTLLDEDSQLLWRADPIVAAAKALNRELAEPVNAAEIAKFEACEALYTAAEEESFSEDEGSLAEKIWSDLGLLFVRVFPVESVERCARALERYSRELDALRRRLEEEGVYPRSRD